MEFRQSNTAVMMMDRNTLRPIAKMGMDQFGLMEAIGRTISHLDRLETNGWNGVHYHYIGFNEGIPCQLRVSRITTEIWNGIASFSIAVRYNYNEEWQFLTWAVQEI